MAKTYEVLVGNIGTVYSGPSSTVARREYAAYVRLSKQSTGRASGEPVTLFVDHEIVKEYTGKDESNDNH